jgi:hypothetical protein
MWIIDLPAACIVRNRPEDYGYYPDGKRFEDGHKPHSEEHVSGADIRFRDVLKKRTLNTLMDCQVKTLKRSLIPLFM